VTYLKINEPVFTKQIENVGYGRSGQTSIDAFPVNKLEYPERVLIKRRPPQKHIQNDIGINKSVHFRYLASLSERISSRLISPRWDAIPKSIRYNHESIMII
jgi:hypothetical protein